MSRMLNAPNVWLFLMGTIVLGSCTVTHKSDHGDAVFIERRHGLFPMVDTLVLPEFDLTRTTEYRWQVRDLPHVAYPTALMLYPRREDIENETENHRAPWRASVVSISLIDPDGAIFFSTRLDLATWNGSASNVDGRWEVSIYFSDELRNGAPLTELRLTSYDVLLRVESPSTRAGDRAHLFASFWNGAKSSSKD